VCRHYVILIVYVVLDRLRRVARATQQQQKGIGLGLAAGAGSGKGDCCVVKVVFPGRLRDVVLEQDSHLGLLVIIALKEDVRAEKRVAALMRREAFLLQIGVERRTRFPFP